MPSGVYERSNARFGRRKEAREKSEKHFLSPEPCEKCNTYERYTSSGSCKVCVRNYKEKTKEIIRNNHLTRKYGITLEKYNEMLEKQNSVCAICGHKEELRQDENLCVDHNHETNKVRGLLCNRCNTAIGLLRDDVNTIQQAINYLRENDETI